jgi:hypothetical protein
VSAAGTTISRASDDKRRYGWHWLPIHPDFVVKDFELATEKMIRAGATREGETCTTPYGKWSCSPAPFGHDFCLIEFNALRYEVLIPDNGPPAG